VSHVLALDGGWALLGWMSGGAPFQSQELIVLNDSLELTARLSWFTYRSETCVLLRRDAAGWSLGIPGGTSEESALSINEKRVKPVFGRFELTETTWSYCPPAREPMKPPKQVAWFKLTVKGFEAASPRDAGR
jgi:hypothetical protein